MLRGFLITPREARGTKQTLRAGSVPAALGAGVFYLAVSIFAAGEASATTVVELSANDLVTRSQKIFHGLCRDVHSYLDSRQRIVTRYTFTVVETLKGEHESWFSFVQPGGEYRGVTTLIPGLSSHRVGDEVILFLGPTGTTSELCLPVGLNQGLYRIVVDRRSGSYWVRRSLSGLHTLRLPHAKQQGHFPDHARLDHFKQVLRAKVEELNRNPR